MKRKCQESDPMTHLNPAYIQELVDIVNRSPFPDHMRMQLSSILTEVKSISNDTC
jgi:hypothetical protein